MSEPFVGEIRMFGFNFAPSGWALCNGQILSIAQNDFLFAVIGTTYGGDGQTTFALPNLSGRLPVHWGAPPGASNVSLGEQGGAYEVTLTTNQLPSHTHPIVGRTGPRTVASPNGASLVPGDIYGSGTTNANLSSNAVSAVGAGQPHTNVQPYLVINFCIALYGIFPPPQ